MDHWAQIIRNWDDEAFVQPSSLGDNANEAIEVSETPPSVEVENSAVDFDASVALRTLNSLM